MSFKLKNFTMEKFNNDVNHSGNLDKKYSAWANYRKNINMFIKNSIKGKSCNNIFIFGAGECNDIDLKFLTDIFDSVTLSDIDDISVNEGILRQKLSESAKAKINVVMADYTGLHKKGFFQQISDLINDKKTEMEISKHIKTAISELKDTDILSSYKNNYSVVLVLPTYTQIAYTQMEALLRILYQYNIYEVDDLNKIITTLYNLMPKIIGRYNDLILSLVSDNDVVLVLTDILEITDSHVQEKLLSNINDTSYMKNYLETDYSDLGKMGLDNLNNKIKILNEIYTFWPFDKGKDYVVSMVEGCKQR